MQLQASSASLWRPPQTVHKLCEDFTIGNVQLHLHVLQPKGVQLRGAGMNPYASVTKGNLGAPQSEFQNIDRPTSLRNSSSKLKLEDRDRCEIEFRFADHC